jgi:hypothetical protein
MWHTCPNCGAKPAIHPLTYSEVIKACEAGTHTGFCFRCFHRWPVSPEEQKRIAEAANQLLAEMHP